MRIHLPLGSLWVGEGEGEAAEIFPMDQVNQFPPPPLPPVPLTECDESNPSVRTLNWGTQFGPHGQGNELIGPPDPVIVSCNDTDTCWLVIRLEEGCGGEGGTKGLTPKTRRGGERGNAN